MTVERRNRPTIAEFRARPMPIARRNRKSLLSLLAVVGVMGGAAWASVPLYDWFCRVTGFGGTPLVAEAVGDTVLDQVITVRFDASLSSDMPWTFRPLERAIETRVGEQNLAFYEAHNPTNSPVAGSASFNVYPFSVGAYFTKIDCFCFEEQLLMPGERVEMPVSFFVDPGIVDDAETRDLGVIILSYTFHRVEGPGIQDPANLAQLEPGQPATSQDL